MSNYDLATSTTSISLLTVDSSVRCSSLPDHVIDDGLQEWIAFKTDIFKDENKTNNATPTQSTVPGQGTTGRYRNRAVGLKSLSTNIASTNRAKFLVGFNRIDNIVAVTYLEESRLVTHDRPNSLATSLRYELIGFYCTTHKLKV